MAVQIVLHNGVGTYADNHRVAGRTGIGLLNKGENKWEDQSEKIE